MGWSILGGRKLKDSGLIPASKKTKKVLLEAIWSKEAGNIYGRERGHTVVIDRKMQIHLDCQTFSANGCVLALQAGEDMYANVHFKSYSCLTMENIRDGLELSLMEWAVYEWK